MKEELLQIQASTFSALAHPLRLKILEKLRNGACCVCKIIPYVGGEQSNVSHHLAILRKTGIVRNKKKGLEVWYEVIDPKVFDIVDLVNKHIIEDLSRSNHLLKILTK